jgi:integrase/recombinase XerD
MKYQIVSERICREDEFRLRITGKCSKVRFIRISGSLRKRISRVYPNTSTYLFESSPGTHYARQTIFEIVQRAGKRVGIRGLHPHSLRHYFATEMIDKTGDIEAVSHYLGHSEVSTTLGMYYHNRELTMEQLRFNFYGRRDGSSGGN